MVLPVAILAGGLATRLRPATERIPKALIEINGEPFLAHQLRLLRRKGIERAVLCAGYLGEQLRAYAGSGEAFGLRIDYSFDGPTLLGTAGAIRRALPLLGDSFLVLYGDSYLPCDYVAVASAFDRQNKSGLMTIYHNEGRWDWSNVEFHYDCEKRKWTIDDVKLGNLTALLAKIRPAVEATEYKGERSAKNYAFVDAVARKNVELTIAKIREQSPVLKDLESSGSIKIAGSMYNLETGAVDFF